MIEGNTLFRRKHIGLIARSASLLLLIATVTLIVTTIIRRSRLVQAPPPVRAAPVLSDQVISITEGYRYSTTEQGKRKFDLAAARDTSYADGRHELDQLDLTAFASDGKQSLRIFADRGSYRQEDGVVKLTGHVKVVKAEGLEVMTESLLYNQSDEVATTDVAIQFKQNALSGSATGAMLNAKLHVLALHKDVHLVNAPAEKVKGSLPVEIHSTRADFAEHEGIVRFQGETRVAQGKQTAQGDAITGFLEPKTQQLLRIEMRGKSLLRSEEVGKLSSLEARDIDFFFDNLQHLKTAIATGAARAKSLEKNAPREITSERLEATFKPIETGSEIQTINAQGRTTLKVSPEPGSGKPKAQVDSVMEADSMKVTFTPDGKFLALAEAAGNITLSMTPQIVTPQSDRKRASAAKLKADFHENENVIKSFAADGNALVEFEPLVPESKRTKRTLSGKAIAGRISQSTQEISELVVDGDAKFSDGDRQGTAARATYTAAKEMVELRGKPVIWDSSSRSNADEIDASLPDQQSFARGRVRTTYYSRETTGGAAPFKKNKAPVFLTSERAVVRHRETVARFEGDVRAWQDDNFVSADMIEVDNGERQMKASGNVQSALYNLEREVEKGKKEIVPTFVNADELSYQDQTREVHYEGKVRIRQGSDRIDAAVADATIDEENRLKRMTASKDVVLLQPQRRGTGDRLEYLASNETAVLTGNLAEIEDKERGVWTKGARLTLHLRDARIEANDESGAKRVKTTHRIQR